MFAWWKPAPTLDLVFIQAPPWGVTTAPLGPAWCMAVLRARRYTVRFCDANGILYQAAPPALRSTWHTDALSYWVSGRACADHDEEIQRGAGDIARSGARAIALSMTFAAIPWVNRFVECVRKHAPDMTIIVGGAGTTHALHRAHLRKDIIEYAIIGEGEIILGDMIDMLRRRRGLEHLRKVRTWKDAPGDHMTCLECREPANLDRLPRATFEECDFSLYTERDLLPVSFSRGCVNQCHFCTDWPLKAPYRFRSPQRIVDDMSWLVTRYGRRRFEVVDLLVNGTLGHLEAVCDHLIARRLEVAWGGQAMVRDDMSPSLFRKMKQAGCGGLTFGFETFSDRLLVHMNKRRTAGEAARVVHRAKAAGMLVEANLLVGFPGEEEADIDATIAFVKRNRAYIDRVNSLNICSIGPGMYVWDHLSEFNISKNGINDWYAWHTIDGANTLDVRLARHQRLKEALVALGYTPAWENVETK